MKKLVLTLSIACSLAAMEDSDERSGKRQKTEDSKVTLIEIAEIQEKGKVPTLFTLANRTFIKHKASTFAETISKTNYDDALKQLRLLPSDCLYVVLKKVINEYNFNRMTGENCEGDIAMQFAADLAQPLSHNLFSFLRYAQEKNELVVSHKICVKINQEMDTMGTNNATPRCYLTPFYSTEILSKVKGKKYVEAFGKLLWLLPWKSHNSGRTCGECAGKSYLHLLAASENIKLMEWVLEYDKKHTLTRDNNGHVYEDNPGHDHIIRAKIDVNVQEEETNFYGYRPLHYAVAGVAESYIAYPSLSMVKLLLKNGADPHVDLKLNHMSPLGRSCTNYRPEEIGIEELKKIIDYLKSLRGSDKDNSTEKYVKNNRTELMKEDYPLIAYAYPDLAKYLK